MNVCCVMANDGNFQTNQLVQFYTNFNDRKEFLVVIVLGFR